MLDDLGFTFERQIRLTDTSPDVDLLARDTTESGDDEMEQERTGEAFEGEIQLTVLGPRLEPGDRAPDFTLDAFGPGDACRGRSGSRIRPGACGCSTS